MKNEFLKQFLFFPLNRGQFFSFSTRTTKIPRPFPLKQVTLVPVLVLPVHVRPQVRGGGKTKLTVETKDVLDETSILVLISFWLISL